MRSKLDRKRKPLISNYISEEKRIFFVSVAIVILLALPDYGGQYFITTVMKEFSEWMSEWITQLEVIAATRDNPVRTRIVLASVIAMMPVQAGYFMCTMPVKVIQERLPLIIIIKKAFSALVATIIAGGIFLVLFYGVLLIPSEEAPGNIAQRLMPIVISDMGSGLILLIITVGTMYVLSASLVFIYLIFRDFPNYREIEE